MVPGCVQYMNKSVLSFIESIFVFLDENMLWIFVSVSFSKISLVLYHIVQQIYMFTTSFVTVACKRRLILREC